MSHPRTQVGRSCAPALLRSCDYTSWQPSPPCQAARVTFPSGISQSPHAKGTASGSLAAVPATAGMLTSQSSQPSHSLAPAAFTQTGPLPSAAAPQQATPPAGGGCSSIFVLGKLHGAEQGSKVIVLRHRPICNLLRGEGWTRATCREPEEVTCIEPWPSCPPDRWRRPLLLPGCAGLQGAGGVSGGAGRRSLPSSGGSDHHRASGHGPLHAPWRNRGLHLLADAFRI